METWEIYLEGATHSINHNGSLPKLIRLGSGELFSLLESETVTLSHNSKQTFGKAYYQIAVVKEWKWIHTFKENQMDRGGSDAVLFRRMAEKIENRGGSDAV